MPTRKALKWVMIWGALSLGLNAFIYFTQGKRAALAYLGAYFLEQSLSMDNLFVFIMVFSSFSIPPAYQRRVLNYGIIGAMILRFLFVLLGLHYIKRFYWLLYLFGLILILSGLNVMLGKEKEGGIKDSLLIRFFSKLLPMTPTLHGERLFVREKGHLLATPLFVILLLIESSDILFAMDSIPAIFSITMDPFIVYTSNLFAILGLRSLYFLLGNLKERFKYVKYGIGLVLVFTGIKLAALYFKIVIPMELSILTIFAIMAVSILASAFSAHESGRSKSY